MAAQPEGSGLAGPTVSIVVVSRDRPQSLIWCLTGIDGLDYPSFEVVVVACPAGCRAVQSAGYENRVKLIAFDEANISAARNLGIASAAGEVVAFIDDDAVPEPTWLRHLTAPFADCSVAAVGGYVRGRNGISFQWRARQVDCGGEPSPIQVDGEAWCKPAPAEGYAIKTEGTNMAAQRDVLAALGGFDPGFHFFLDETDLNLRLHRAGQVTAIAPLAQVHHAYAASSRRASNRAVTDLSQIGASAMYFLRKHCPVDERQARLNRILRDQQMRVFDQVKSRMIHKSDVGPLIKGLQAGVAEGQTRNLVPLVPLPSPQGGFLPFHPARKGGTVLSGRVWQARRLRREAAERAAGGENVSLFLFGPSTRYHWVKFKDDGYWEQIGGLWGRGERAGPIFQPTGFARRLRREVERVADLRGI
ncbi:glycosyltransferase [Alisedimentitalea sp. MJ-SS2]|uniref:glycosyltransferase family 2 protein n=1 Tax=Aliisedimentitalea sp. MJ-SS2 TaxID=3049795 RepID=UPI00290D0312|nr:glycosyltransferase [Alisedimentitalea sp. MJ-SS2]MDU8927853.1 glycosyltransferase [Alisedimentitalea sp. MJ-SS2]